MILNTTIRMKTKFTDLKTQVYCRRCRRRWRGRWGLENSGSISFASSTGSSTRTFWPFTTRTTKFSKAKRTIFSISTTTTAGSRATINSIATTTTTEACSVAASWNSYQWDQKYSIIKVFIIDLPKYHHHLAQLNSHQIGSFKIFLDSIHNCKRNMINTYNSLKILTSKFHYIGNSTYANTNKNKIF